MSRIERVGGGQVPLRSDYSKSPLRQDYSKSSQGRIILSPPKARNFWVCLKFGFVRSLGLFELWVCAKFRFVRSFGFFEAWVCSKFEFVRLHRSSSIYICKKKFFPKFEIIRIKNTRVRDYIRKINSVAAFRGVERSTHTKSRARAPSVWANHKHQDEEEEAERFFF